MTPEAARKAIRAHVPTVAVDTIEGPRAGTSNDSFRVDGRWIFRFPKNDEAAREVARERIVLGQIASELPLAVPRFVRVVEPCEEAPCGFVAYAAVPGEGLYPEAFARLSTRDRSAMARSLGVFLRTLHAIPVAPIEDLVRSRGLPFGPTAKAFRERKEGVVTRLESSLESARDHPRWEEVRRLVAPIIADRYARTVTRTVCHADISEEHLLFDPETRRLTGMIDWGNVVAGDPFDDWSQVARIWGRPFALEAITMYPPPLREELHTRVGQLGPVLEDAELVRAVLGGGSS